MKLTLLLASAALLVQALAVNKCGTSYSNSACGTQCPRGLDSECRAGERCYADAPQCNNPGSGGNNKCGSSYSSSGCGSQCPRGLDSECRSGERCYADPPQCSGSTPFPTQFPVNGPSPTPFPTQFPVNGPSPTQFPVNGPSPTPFPVAVPSGSNCKVGSTPGRCQPVSSCSGISVAGFCSGGSSTQCCVLEPTSSTVMHTPDRPVTSNSAGSCRTPQDAFNGQCIPTSQCTGATFNDLCPGSSKCCVTETDSVPDLLNDRTMASQIGHLALLTYSQFRNLYTGVSSARAQALFPFYNYGLAEVLMDSRSSSESCYRSAAFAAQIGHESVGLTYFEEIASGAAYEGREDLGNIYPGDGVRYKGRGPLQLTGRYNYEEAGRRLGANLEADPEKVCFPSMGFLTTVDYWMSRGLNRYAGSSSESDFVTLTKLINGGTNGLTDRKNRWYAARRLLGCDNLRSKENQEESQQMSGTETFGVVAFVLVGAALAVVAVIRNRTNQIEQEKEDGEVQSEEELKPKSRSKFQAANPMFQAEE